MTTRYRQDKNNKTKKYPSYANAILNINANAEFSMEYDESDNPKWDTLWFGENTTPISQEDIENKYQELKTNWEEKNYQDGRIKEYPPIEQQLDDIFHNGIDGWKETIQAVKDKYPKE